MRRTRRRGRLQRTRDACQRAMGCPHGVRAWALYCGAYFCPSSPWAAAASWCEVAPLSGAAEPRVADATAAGAVGFLGTWQDAGLSKNDSRDMNALRWLDLLCILVKQWLAKYTTRTTASAWNRLWARRRMFYLACHAERPQAHASAHEDERTGKTAVSPYPVTPPADSVGHAIT